MALITREITSTPGTGNFTPNGAYTVYESVLYANDGQTSLAGLSGTQITGAIATITPTMTPVHSVTVRYRGRVIPDGARVARNLTASLRFGSTIYWSSDYLIDGTIYTENDEWAYYEFVYDECPATNEAWTVEDVQSITRIDARAAVAAGGSTADFEIDHIQIEVDFGTAGSHFVIGVNDTVGYAENVSVSLDDALFRTVGDTGNTSDTLTAILRFPEPDNVVTTALATIPSPGNWVADSGNTLVDALSTVDGIVARPGIASTNLWGTVEWPPISGELEWVRMRAIARIIPGENQTRRNLTVMMTIGSLIAHPNAITMNNTEYDEFTWTWTENPATNEPWLISDLQDISRIYLRAFSAGAGQDADIEVDRFLIDVGYNIGDPTVMTVTIDDTGTIQDTQNPQQLVITTDENYTATRNDAGTVGDVLQAILHTGTVYRVNIVDAGRTADDLAASGGPQGTIYRVGLDDAIGLADSLSRVHTGPPVALSRVARVCRGDVRLARVYLGNLLLWEE